MPGVRVSLATPRPDVARMAGQSLGAQLRRRRRELELRCDQAAELLGVDPKTLTWWERDARLPFIRAYPAITGFLGYEPWSEPSSLSEALLGARRRRGLEIRKAAELLGVDEGTWRRWETGEWKPTSATLPAIDRLLGYSIKLAFPADVR